MGVARRIASFAGDPGGSWRECIDAMNPCMREFRMIMYLCTRDHTYTLEMQNKA